MEYKHFSHEHPLSLYRVEAATAAAAGFRCSGCHQLCRQSDSIFACWKCNFFLHDHCGNANRYVKHPSHTLHPLILLPTPTYCSGSFLCNACGAPGNSFAYCCALCEVDLHLPCAYLPPKVTHPSHQHELCLSFQKLPTTSESSSVCSICTKQLNSNNWSYFCNKPECHFRVHTYCATTEVKPGLYQDDEPDEAQTPSSDSNLPQDQSQEDMLAEMFRLQMQIQMHQQMAQMISHAMPQI